MKANAPRTAPSHANVEKVVRVWKPRDRSDTWKGNKTELTKRARVQNAELFTFTYGAVVRQLIEDYEDLDEVNKQLDEMGYNIGVRIIDDFLAKSEADKCITFEGTVQTIAGSAFRMFLGVTATVEKWNEDKTECSLLLEDNPMVDHVEIPEKNAKLVYCNMLCGVLRGALLQVSLRVQASIERDVLKGDDVTEIRLRLLEQIPEEYPFKDDE